MDSDLITVGSVFCFLDIVIFIDHGSAGSAIETNRIVYVESQQEVLYFFIPHAIPEADQIVGSVFLLGKAAEGIVIVMIFIQPVSVGNVISFSVDNIGIGAGYRQRPCFSRLQDRHPLS